MDCMRIDGYDIEVISKNTVIVGAGAAALNAADWLFEYGIHDIAIVCEDLNLSTSRNTGSDKQTYYKLTLSGDEPDSVGELAKTLMSGQCVDGDIAMAEAANSVPCFLRLCNLGVPFPKNRYGEYIGYKTDHDPRRRATSAGPLTSRLMTECLERAVLKKHIPVFPGFQVISLLTGDEKVLGMLCLNLSEFNEKNKRFIAFHCTNIIYATGGPAGMYADSVYPEGQYGSTGLAFLAGAKGKNLTEWQYGLSSIDPRWNVSGTYMQVLPRFISTENNGTDEREFLQDFFADKGAMFSSIFMKGYQWPFDVKKAAGGSSVIDILVYVERCIKGRRVFLDYRKNPENLDFSLLTNEAFQYLEKGGALFGSPADRLIHMNAPAYDFYISKGVDLKTDPLEIALCVQHNNGGLAVDCWWQTNIAGLFAAGEASSTHGVVRPGGSALNAGQVGSMRAAQYIAQLRSGNKRAIEDFKPAVREKIAGIIKLSEKTISSQENVSDYLAEVQHKMSNTGAAIRDYKKICGLIDEIRELIGQFEERVKIHSESSLSMLFKLYDVLVCQFVYLCAMKDYIEKGGKSRGSALYYDLSGEKPDDALQEVFRYKPDDGLLGSVVQEVLFKDGSCIFEWRTVRDILKEDDFFENVWKKYRKNGNIY